MSAPRSETAPGGEPAPDSEPDAAAASRPRTKRRTDGEQKPGLPPVRAGEVEPEATVASENGVGAEPEADAEPRSEAKPDSDPDLDSEAEPDSEADTAERGPAAGTDADPTVEVKPVPMAEPTAEPGSSARPAEADDPDPVLPVLPPIRPSAAARARRIRRLVVLGVAAVVLVAATVVTAVGAMAARDSGALSNKAFVDSPATAEVIGQVTDAVATVYSYDYKSLPASESAAKAVITGKFADDFNRVFEPVKQLAPSQQAVLRTTVRAAGVSQLQGDRARLLMMVDQSGVRGAAKEPTGATARLVVDAQKVDGRWKISEVTPE